MTLILSCLTHDYVVQVSDRRLVWIDSRQEVRIGDDNTNKVVAHCNIGAFGYTGLAKISGKKTDEWLANEMSPVSNPSIFSISDVCSVIAARATKDFKKPPISNLSKNDRRHAFVYCGWTALGGDFNPVLVTVSNFQDEDGEILAEANVEFTIKSRLLQPSEQFHLEVTGQPVNKNSKKQKEALIRTCIKRKKGSRPIARILVDLIRETASNNRKVGENLLMVSIPKESVSLDEMFFFSAIPQQEIATFLYLPKDSIEGIRYGPRMVCKGNQVFEFKTERFN